MLSLNLLLIAYSMIEFETVCRGLIRTGLDWIGSDVEEGALEEDVLAARSIPRWPLPWRRCVRALILFACGACVRVRADHDDPVLLHHRARVYRPQGDRCGARRSFWRRRRRLRDGGEPCEAHTHADTYASIHLHLAVLVLVHAHVHTVWHAHAHACEFGAERCSWLRASSMFFASAVPSC